MTGSQSNSQILILDGDAASVEPLRDKLGEVGFELRVITHAAGALTALTERPPQLLIMDWNMPGLAALEVMQRICGARYPQHIRLIIVSCSAAEQDVVTALNLGADDYLAKPFSVRELVARVCSLMRTNKNQERGSFYNCGELILDGATNRVTAQGELVTLRGIEYRLLKFLMTHPGRTFTRAQLLSQVWGGPKLIDERTVDVNVQRLRRALLRRKLGNYIQTVRGSGYRLVVSDGRGCSK